MPSSPESDGHQERSAQSSAVSEHGTQAAAEQPAAALAAENGELTAALAQAEERYKRALADLDNYRKRTAREIERRVAEAKESLLRDWLEAVDSVERALRIEADGPCADGLRAVLEQMDAVLAREGARRIGEAGEPFDPELHEAIAVRALDSVPDRTVVAVERAGLALNDRVIRPAQVVVARAPEHAG
jgi:molecular chaperone GrpE